MNKKLKLSELGRVSPLEYQGKEKIPLILILDNVRSGHNIGSFFRTGDAYLVEKILLCGITAKPPHRDIQKSALGSTETVDWEYHENCLEAVRLLKNDGYTIISIEQAEKTVSLEDLKIDKEEKVAVVFGNEVKGVQQEVIDESNFCMELPQYGTKHSLNVSVCGGIVIWELFQKMKDYI